MRHEQLKFAREFREMNQTQLSSKVVGLSQSNLSKYEKGIETLSDEVLYRIMDVLHFPFDFLDIRIENKAENKHYRKKASIKASDRDKIDRFTSLVAYCFDWMSEELELPTFQFRYTDIECGTTPEEIALQVRRQFKLGVAPIDNIFNFLERNGVSVYLWDCDYNDFDGVSLITDKGNNLIIVNKNMSNDRVRFSLAHELGHIIMHLCCDFMVLQSRDKEMEANRFASEFLMPTQGIKSSLLNIKFSQLPILKSYWLTSMASIIRRAKTLNQIDEKKYTNLMTEISRRGWRMKEPYPVHIDNATIINKSYKVMNEILDYDIKTMSSSMCLPIDVVNSIFNIRNNILRIA